MCIRDRLGDVIDMPIQDKPSSSGARAAASATAQIVPSRETLESAYDSVKDRVGKILDTVRSFENPIPHKTRKINPEPRYEKQLERFGTPEAVMRKELDVASTMLTLLTPDSTRPISYEEASREQDNIRKLNTAMAFIDYARQQMQTSQEYQDTRQAQALGLSSLASGLVRMPGQPSAYDHNNNEVDQEAYHAIYKHASAIQE